MTPTPRAKAEAEAEAGEVKASRRAVLGGAGYREQTAALRPDAVEARAREQEGPSPLAEAPARPEAVAELARVTLRVFADIGAAIIVHTHGGAIGPTAAPTMGVILPTRVAGTETDIATLAGHIQSELLLLLKTLITHVHATSMGPTSPALVPPPVPRCGGSEADVPTLGAALLKDLTALSEWHGLHTHGTDTGPVSPPQVPLAPSLLAPLSQLLAASG